MRNLISPVIAVLSYPQADVDRDSSALCRRPRMSEGRTEPLLCAGQPLRRRPCGESRLFESGCVLSTDRPTPLPLSLDTQQRATEEPIRCERRGLATAC